jgi:ferredoxin
MTRKPAFGPSLNPGRGRRSSGRGRVDAEAAGPAPRRGRDRVDSEAADPAPHDIAAALAARGVSPGSVKTEIFGPSDASTPGIVAGESAPDPHPPPGDPGTGSMVAFSRSNLSVRWDPALGTLLEFAEACDVPVRWSCRTGVCRTCETGLVGGEVGYEPDPLEQPTAGSALICCSRPDGDIVLDL